MLLVLRSFSAVLLLSGLMVAAAAPGSADDGNPDALVGHWRKTTIQRLGPRDEHLVLSEDGTMTDWIVTAESRTEPASGAWRVDGNILTISVDGRVTMS